MLARREEEPGGLTRLHTNMEQLLIIIFVLVIMSVMVEQSQTEEYVPVRESSNPGPDQPIG